MPATPLAAPMPRIARSRNARSATTRQTPARPAVPANARPVPQRTGLPDLLASACTQVPGAMNTPIAPSPAVSAQPADGRADAVSYGVSSPNLAGFASVRPADFFLG